MSRSCGQIKYSAISHICCGGFVHRKSGLGRTACCGSHIFNSQTQLCKRGVVHTKIKPRNNSSLASWYVKFACFSNWNRPCVSVKVLVFPMKLCLIVFGKYKLVLNNFEKGSGEHIFFPRKWQNWEVTLCKPPYNIQTFTIGGRECGSRVTTTWMYHLANYHRAYEQRY